MFGAGRSFVPPPVGSKHTTNTNTSANTKMIMNTNSITITSLEAHWHTIATANYEYGQSINASADFDSFAISHPAMYVRVVR